MAPPILADEMDEDYASSEDSDFAPDTAPVAGDSDSEAEDSEDELAADFSNKDKAKKSVKRRQDEAENEDIGFENSGDEAVIGKGLKKQKKRKQSGKTAEGGDHDDDEGGEGGFVRTRAMKAAAGPNLKNPLASAGATTVDVDALWKQMMAEPFKRVDALSLPLPPPADDDTMDVDVPSTNADEPDDMIMIERTYKFAGKVHSESKLVPRASAEAQLWLKTHPTPSVPVAAPSATFEKATSKPIRRPKAQRSIFEPATEALVARTDLRFKTTTYKGPSISELEALRAKEKARKLNTVEKSKMDWAGFVDKEGIKEDLEKAGKSKGTYLDNQEFLARAEERREEEARRARGVAV